MNLPVSTVKSALQDYQQYAKDGKDVWGITTFTGVPLDDLAHEVFYTGMVTSDLQSALVLVGRLKT